MHQIKEYEEKYKSALINLIIEVLIEEFGFEEHREEIQNSQFIYGSGEKCWIAVDEKEQVIGTISCKKLNENECEMKKFYVKEEYRGQKIAKCLYEAFYEFAKENKYKKVYLGTYTKLERAINFYKKRGFIEYKNDEEVGAKYFFKEI